MRCSSIFEYFKFKEPGRLYKNTEVIESDTYVVQCVLLTGHSGNHMAIVPGVGPFQWWRR